MEKHVGFDEKLLFFASKHDFEDIKNKHAELISQHHFVHVISLVIPSPENFSVDLSSLIGTAKYFSAKQITLYSLINLNFIEAFVKRGSLSLMSTDTKIDSSFCLCVLPTGQLILNVDKDTYQCLGLQGQPSKFHQKSKSKYVIEVNLKELPSKLKLFYKIKRQFLKNEQKFDVLFSWQAPSDEIESSSVQMYFQNKRFTCTEEKFITNSQVLHNTCVPFVDPDQPDSCLEGGGPEDFYEWMGAISCQCTFGDVDNYENHMLRPREACTVAKCSLLTLKGFFTSQMVESIFQQIRSISHNGNLTREQQKNVLHFEPQHPWICMTMHGFVDAPVCWNRKENGFYISGVNNHSVIIFHRSPHLWSFLTQHPRNLSM